MQLILTIPPGYKPQGEYRIPRIGEHYLDHHGNCAIQCFFEQRNSFFILIPDAPVEEHLYDITLPEYGRFQPTGEYRQVFRHEYCVGPEGPTQWKDYLPSSSQYIVLKLVFGNLKYGDKFMFSMGETVFEVLRKQDPYNAKSTKTGALFEVGYSVPVFLET